LLKAYRSEPRPSDGLLWEAMKEGCCYEHCDASEQEGWEEYFQEKSKVFADLALKVCNSVDGFKSEIAKSLDHLMYAKDAAVRAAFQK